MTKAELNMAAVLLTMAADQFGNHGCNDFDLAELFETQEEIEAFARAYHTWNGDPDSVDERKPENLRYSVPDFAAMRYIASLCERESEAD